MKLILSYFKPYKKLILAAIPLYATTTAAALLMPFFMANIVNLGIAENNIRYIITEGAIMLSLSFAGVVTAIFAAKINSKISAGFSAGIFKGVFKKVNSFSMDEFLQHGTSGLLTRSTHDMYVLYEFASNIVSIGVNIPILFIGGIILSMINDYVLALIFFAAAPVVIFIVWLITRRMGKLWEKADKYIDDQNKIVRERLSGIRVIRAFDREDHEHERMAFATRRMASNIIRANVLSGSVMPSVAFLFNLAIIVVLYVGSMRLSTSQTLSAGDILATVQYISLVMYGCIMLT
ncbi:MAG: ABC transporter permease, partial [Clostridia bacterium]